MLIRSVKIKSRWQTRELVGIEDPDSMSITSLMSLTGGVAIAGFHKEKNLFDEELSDEGASGD